MVVTAADVQLQDAKTRFVVDTAMTMLCDELEGNNLTVSPYVSQKGLCVHYSIWPHRERDTVYIHAASWARGWSIYASADANGGSYAWRDVAAKFKGMQRPLYCARGVSGPHNVPARDVADAIRQLLAYFKKLSDARLARHRKKYWFWPSSVAAFLQDSI